MSEWISVKNKEPDCDCLVYLEKPLLGRRIHSASCGKKVRLIGCNFSFDCPDILYWMPLPEPPTE